MTNSPLDVESLRRRDPAMTERFVEALRRFARRYFRRRSDIEHVTHDALVELLSKLDRGDQPRSVEQWVVTAASNAAKRRRRGQRPHVAYVSTIHTTSSAATLSEIHRQRDRLQFIDQSMARMPARTRAALVAIAIEGRRTDSVAAELGVPPGTVRKDVSRARHRLRRELSAQEKLDRLREVACELQRQREAQQGHPSAPRFARPRGRSDDSSAASR